MEDEFTLDQLAQLSLGSAEFGQLNITLLHTIVNLALKKLGCENEKVKIYGVAAENLKELLKNSSFTPTLVFTEENHQTPLNDLDTKIADLEKKVKELEQKFDEHLKEGEKAGDLRFETEDNNERISAVLRDDWFLQHFKQIVNNIFTCRLDRMKFNISNLERVMQKFAVKCSEAHEKMVTIDILESKYFDLMDHIIDYRADFKKSLNEIQYLLDQKVDNCDVSPLKKRIRVIIENSAESARKMVELKTTPRVLLSCIEIDSDGKWKNMNAKRVESEKPKFLACVCEKNFIPKRKSSDETDKICRCKAHPVEKLTLVERIGTATRAKIIGRLTWTETIDEKYSAIKD